MVQMAAQTGTYDGEGHYQVVLMNRRDGGVEGHAHGCADLTRGSRKFAGDQDPEDAWDVFTKHEAWVGYNSDFLAEGPESGQYEIQWLPCAKHVPQGHEDSWESYLTNDITEEEATQMGLADEYRAQQKALAETASRKATALEGTTTTRKTTEKESTMSTTATTKAPSTPNVRTYDTSSKDLRIKALGVDCTIPYCRATPDESCVSAKGKEVEPHTRRVQRALAMEKAAAKKAAKAQADPKAASKAAAAPAKGKKASTKKADKPVVEEAPVEETTPEPAPVCKPCAGRHHKQCKGTDEAPCGCTSKVHA
jgi:hypothetical protein